MEAEERITFPTDFYDCIVYSDEMSSGCSPGSFRDKTEGPKGNYDTKEQVRKFTPSHKGLLLLPMSENKLQVKWQSPYELV